MSLYNMIFGINDLAELLLFALGFNENDIPRFRDCFLHEDKIVIHTRTGGGNRDYYESKKRREACYPEDDPAEGTRWNVDLRKHPNFLYDVDADFDNTYANFFYSFPAEYAEELRILSKNHSTSLPSDKWRTVLKGSE